MEKVNVRVSKSFGMNVSKELDHSLESWWAYGSCFLLR